MALTGKGAIIIYQSKCLSVNKEKLFYIYFTKRYSLNRSLYAYRQKSTDKINKSNKTGMVGQGVKFERIRRITGYLVGTLDRFNDAKKAEVQDRVKHGHL